MVLISRLLLNHMRIARIASTPEVLLVIGINWFVASSTSSICIAQELRPAAKPQPATSNESIQLHAAISPKPAKTTPKPNQGDWLSRKYPLIKWNSHPITTIPGSTAQLNTTFTGRKDIFGRRVMRYTLTVSAMPQQNTSLVVQLLDTNGFALTEFEIARERFHPVPGTTLMEAAHEHPCTASAYKKARDYVVM